MVEPYALTTIDNPYNPFTDFDGWFRFDMDHGYGTCSYLARLVFVSPALSDEENTVITNQAIDDIINADPFGLYKKVKQNDRVIPIPFKLEQIKRCIILLVNYFAKLLNCFVHKFDSC